MLAKIVLYGIVGWIAEVVWTGMGSLLKGDPRLTGQTYLWMFFIYASGIFLEGVHNQIRPVHWVVRGLIYMLLIFLIEYSSGWLLERLIGVCPWDYTGTPFSVQGYIRLDYAPVWFFTGLVFERLHDFFDRLLLLLEKGGIR